MFLLVVAFDERVQMCRIMSCAPHPTVIARTRSIDLRCSRSIRAVISSLPVVRFSSKPVEPEGAGDLGSDQEPVDLTILTEANGGGGPADTATPEDCEDQDSSPAPIWTSIDWKICGLLLVVSLLLVGLHVRSYESLSPIDELQHIDYVIRAGDFDIPVRNDRVGQEALAEAACRSVDAPGYVGPACGLATYDPNDFQENGFNTAVSQFPPYYVTTGVGARLLTAVGLFESKVTAARMLGAVWLAAALSVTWYLMACLGLRRRSRAPVIALLLVTPLTIFHAGATVNADVSLMLTGALATLATVKYEAGRLRWWWVPLVYVGVILVEATNILAVAACGLYLMVRRIPDATASLTQRLAPLTILPALLLFRVEVAGRLHAKFFPTAQVFVSTDSMSSAPMFVVHRTESVSFEKVIAQLSSTFTPVRNPYLSPPLRSQLTIAGLELTNWLLIALLFSAAIVVVSSARLTWLSRITLVMLLAAGPFYTFYFAYFSNQDFAAPARFALPLVPLMAIAASSAIQRRSTLLAVWGVAALTGLNTVFQLLTA